MTKINEAKIPIIASNGFQQLELEVPRHKLKEAGAKPNLLMLSLSKHEERTDRRFSPHTSTS